MTVLGIDHFVLTVADVEATLEYYSVLGGTAESFDDDRKAVSFGDQKINLHPADAIYSPHARTPTPGSGDFCLIVDERIQTVVDRLRDHGVEIVEGPVERVGASGPMTSVYVRDPDGNLVELARYETGTETPDER